MRPVAHPCGLRSADLECGLSASNPCVYRKLSLACNSIAVVVPTVDAEGEIGLGDGHVLAVTSRLAYEIDSIAVRQPTFEFM